MVASLPSLMPLLLFSLTPLIRPFLSGGEASSCGRSCWTKRRGRIRAGVLCHFTAALRDYRFFVSIVGLKDLAAFQLNNLLSPQRGISQRCFFLWPSFLRTRTILL